VAAIREKLAELRAADPDLRVFGASRHRYELNPPVDEAFLARFEAEVGVPLTADVDFGELLGQPDD
jgi:hypothetical protein